MSAPTTVQWLRTAATRVSVGSARLAAHLAVGMARRGLKEWRRATGWLGEGQGIGWLLRLAVLIGVAAILRKLGMSVLAALYGHVAAGGAPWLMWGAAAVWLIAAYRCGRDDWQPKQRPKPAPEQPVEQQLADDADEEQPEPAVEQAPTGPPLPSLADLRLSLAKVGTPHAHLAVIAADLGTTADRVREALAEWSIPVEAVRMQGRGTSTGVKGGTHPALEPTPDDVVAAGQLSNNNSNNAFTTVPDEVNPVRTHVVWRDQRES